MSEGCEPVLVRMKTDKPVFSSYTNLMCVERPQRETATEKKLFESDQSELWSLVYCFSKLDSVMEVVNGADFEESLEGATAGEILDKIYKPLLSFTWSTLESQHLLKSITELLKRFQSALPRYKGAPLPAIFLDQLGEGLCNLWPRRENSDEKPSFTGTIYQHALRISALSDYKPIYLIKVDLTFESRIVPVMLDSKTEYKISVYSDENFYDVRGQSLKKAITQDAPEDVRHNDYLLFDSSTKREIDYWAPVKDLLGKSPLLASELITNLEDQSQALTLRFRYSKDDSISFLLTFQNTCDIRTVINCAEEKISKLMGVHNPKMVFVNQPSCARSSSSPMKNYWEPSPTEVLLSITKPFRNKCPQEFQTVKFDLETRVSTSNFALQSTTNKRVKVSPSDLIEKFYFRKTVKPVTPELSAQALFVEYPMDLGLPVCDLLSDIHCKWLEENTLMRYRLRSIISDSFDSQGQPLTIPLIRTGDSGSSFYSPYHNCSVFGKSDIESVKCLVYERVFQP